MKTHEKGATTEWAADSLSIIAENYNIGLGLSTENGKRPIRPISRFLHGKGRNFDVSLYVCCLWWPNNFPSSTTPPPQPPPPQSLLSLSKPLAPQTTQRQFLKNKTGGVLLAPWKSPVCTKFGCYLDLVYLPHTKIPSIKIDLATYFSWGRKLCSWPFEHISCSHSHQGLLAHHITPHGLEVIIQSLYHTQFVQRHIVSTPLTSTWHHPLTSSDFSLAFKKLGLIVSM